MRHPKRWASGFVLVCTLGTLGCERPTAPDPPVNLKEAHLIRTSLVGPSAEETAEGEEAVDEAASTGWGTIKGRFVLAENAKPRQPIALVVNKDESVCAPGGKPVMDQVFVFDPGTRGIQNIVIFARDAKRVHTDAEPNNEEIVFDQKECIFLTHVLPLRVGQTLSIKNSDPVGHNTNIAATNGAPFNQMIPAEKSLSFKPTAEEALPIGVNCSVHPWMKAYMLPRNNGYFAVSAADGSFEMANVPAGEEVEFQVWHENAAGAGGALPDGAGEGVKIDKRGRFKLKLNDNEVRTLDIVLPGAAFKG